MNVTVPFSHQSLDGKQEERKRVIDTILAQKNEVRAVLLICPASTEPFADGLIRLLKHERNKPACENPPVRIPKSKPPKNK